ncbi:hypothetical protein D3C83_02170 [compost metagenome]
MVVGGVVVLPEADRADLVTVRQPAAAEAVHEEGGAARTGHRRQRLGELLGVVGEGIDLFLRQRRRRRAARRFGRLRDGDRDFFLEAFDLQRDRLVHHPATKCQRRLERFEAGELDVDRDRSDGERRGRRHAPRVRFERERLAVRRRHDHGRRGYAGARLVDDDQPQLRLVGGGSLLREQWRRREQRQEEYD